MKTWVKLALTAAMATSTTAAFAGSPSWYVGIGGGESQTADWYSGSDMESVLDAAAANAGLGGIGTLSSDSDDKDTAWKLFAGYQFHPNFAVEMAYVDLGAATAASRFEGALFDSFGYLGNGSLGVKVQGETQAFTLNGVGKFSLASWVDVYGKAGLYQAESELKISATLSIDGDSASSSDTLDDNTTGVHFGVGADFNVAQNVTIRAEWERFADVEIEDTESDIDLISLSAIYKF